MISLRVLVICLFLVASSSLSLREHLQGFDANVELQLHNSLRAQHGVGNLILDNDLNTLAQQLANKMASTRNFAHSGSKGLGENLYQANGSYNSPSATNAWYNGERYYNYDKPVFSSRTRRFTQLIWKSTLKVGFGFVEGYVAALYFPPGNQRGKFKQNVPPPIL